MRIASGPRDWLTVLTRVQRDITDYLADLALVGTDTDEEAKKISGVADTLEDAAVELRRLSA